MNKPGAIDGAETVFIEANGLRFETAVMEPAGEAKGLALLLHGFPELSYSWRYQMPVFARHGWRVWAPNLRGYGETTRPEGIASYTLDKLVGDVAGLIDASGERRVTLVAHDWGGAIAWSFMLAKVRPVESFIVMNLPHPKRFQEEVRHWAQLKKSWYTLFFQLPWLPEKMLGARGAEGVGNAFRNMAVDKSRFPDEVLDVYRQAALKPGALTAMVNYYRAAFRMPGKWREIWSNPPIIEAPTLMIWGEEDTALGVELTDDTGPLMKDFTLRRLPRVSHWVQQEAPEKVNAMLDAWLEGRPVPEAGEIS